MVYEAPIVSPVIFLEKEALQVVIEYVLEPDFHNDCALELVPPITEAVVELYNLNEAKVSEPV